MDQRAALLQAILNDPDDTPLRLVFADWLEEHGDAADRARAEHIRLQCRYEDLPPGAPERQELWNRAWELEKEHQDAWFGALTALVDDIGLTSRGFPDSITASTAQFLLKAPEIFRLAPIRELLLFGALPHIEGLANCPYLARVRALILIGPAA